MNSKRKQILAKSFLLIVTLALLISCSKDTKPLPSDATFIDNQYDNKFFRFQIKLPEGWYSTDKETMEAISESGKNIIAGDDKNMAAALNVAQKNVYNLVQAFQVAPGTPLAHYNSNITCLAERVSQFPGVKTGKDYLLNAKKLMNSGQLKVLFDEAIQKHNIGGRDFYSMNASISAGGQTIEQKYYATLQDGFILAIVVNFSGSEQQKIIEEAINSINFY